MSTYYVPGAVLGAKDTAVNKRQKFLPSQKLYSSGGETRHKQARPIVWQMVINVLETEQRRGSWSIGGYRRAVPLLDVARKARA